MDYEEKYLKYKKKYLNLKLQRGGFIKGESTIVINYDGYKQKNNIIEQELKKEQSELQRELLQLELQQNKSELESTTTRFKLELNDLMPLCAYDTVKTNLILINDSNYILVNKKINDDYKLYQLNNNFDIIEIDKLQNIIEDNIIIPGINKMIHGINLIQAFNYNNINIFRTFLSQVWITGFDFFNRLKDIMYINFKGQILYENNVNIVLSIIFINKLNYVISLLYNLERLLIEDGNDYYSYNPIRSKNKQFNDIKTSLLIDFIDAYDYLMIDTIKNIDTFDKLKESLNNTFSNIVKLNFNDRKDEFNVFMKILRIIYTCIDTYPEMIEQYNYLLYIDKYKDFDTFNNITTYKSLKIFIDNYNINTIKNKLVLKLSYLIYLSYNTNKEIGTNFKASQYMLLDYFYGITKIKNNCLPINKRQTLLKILEIPETIGLLEPVLTNEIEIGFYKLFQQKFKQIEQYRFNNPISYTDCGETTLLNLFNYLLLKKDGSFDLSDSGSWDIKLKEFYEKYNTMDKMIDTIKDILKLDLSHVFNGRRDTIVYNNKVNQCDINTTITSIIKTCSVLLNIETNNFVDIFLKLNGNINVADIIIDMDKETISYSDKFVLSLNPGHGEFILFLKLDKIPEISVDNNLISTWLVPRKNIRIEKYSFEHFKYLFDNLFIDIGDIPDNQQTEEICMYAVNPPFSMYDKEKVKKFTMENFRKVINITKNIYIAALFLNPLLIKEIPIALLDREIVNNFFENLTVNKYNNEEIIDILNYISSIFKDEEIFHKIKENFLYILSKNPILIKEIPKEFLDKEIYQHAINNIIIHSPLYFKIFLDILITLPFEFKDTVMFNIIKKKLIFYISKKYFYNEDSFISSLYDNFCSLNPEFSDNDIEINIIECISENYLDDHIAEKTFLFINDIPTEFLDKDIYDIIFNKNFNNIVYIPQELQNKEMVDKIILYYSKKKVILSKEINNFKLIYSNNDSDRVMYEYDLAYKQKNYFNLEIINYIQNHILKYVNPVLLQRHP